MPSGFRQYCVLAVVLIVVSLAAYTASPINASAGPTPTESGESEPGESAWGVSEVDTAFRRALVTYAVARGLNGVISVAQGTEVAVQPAGVGLNFAPGEILDPVNDLVERFSWIMMLASSSLGVQRILLTMSGWWVLVIVLGVSGLAWSALSFWGHRRQHLGGSSGEVPLTEATRIAGRLFLFLAVLRFMMPAIAMLNEQVYQTFLVDDYASASSQLQVATDTIGSINEQLTHSGESDADAGFVERARGLLDRTMARLSIDQRIDEYRVAAEAISENTIRLIVVFLMQTVVFPLVFLFVAWGVLKRISRF